MSSPGRVAAADGALDEMTFQNIRARESVPAEYAHVRPVTGVSQEMALQMLRVQISLGTVRAGKLSVCIFLGNGGLASSSRSRRGRSSWCAGEDSTATLRSHHMGRLIALGKHRLLSHQRALAVRRVHARLRNDSRCRHGPQNRRGAATLDARGGCRCNGLWMRSSCRCRGHYSRRRWVLLLRVWVITHARTIGSTATSPVLRGWGRIARHIAVVVRRA